MSTSLPPYRNLHDREPADGPTDELLWDVRAEGDGSGWPEPKLVNDTDNTDPIGFSSPNQVDVVAFDESEDYDLDGRSNEPSALHDAPSVTSELLTRFPRPGAAANRAPQYRVRRVSWLLGAVAFVASAAVAAWVVVG